MEEKNLKAIQKIMKTFSSADFDELIEIARQEKDALIQRLKEERERDAAKLLLSNLEALLKNKESLPLEFVKELEKLSGHGGGDLKKIDPPTGGVVEKKAVIDQPKKISQAA